MKVKLLEHYQDSNIHLYPEQVAEVDDALGAFLLQHNKAEAIHEKKEARHLDVEPQFEQAEEPPHYGAQAEPELRDDEAKSKRLKGRNRSRGAK